jgi:hypothetical protein
MQDWTITLTDGSTIDSASVPAAYLTQVTELVGSKQWADLDPTTSAPALLAWIAVGETVESQDKDLEAHMRQVLTRPLKTLMAQLEIGV